MRQVKEFDTAEGKRYRVRFRQGTVQTSETFLSKRDATQFAVILDGGGVVDALSWLAARDRKQSAITFGVWFEHYVDQLTDVTPRTRGDYRAQKRRYLTHLDAMPLPMITRSHVTGLVNDLSLQGKSPKTIKNVLHMLSSCLALAVDEEHIPRNPCRRVKPPKALAVEEETQFLTHEEFGALHRAIPAHYQPLVAFLAGTGLRWSEATALQARHIDLAAGTVRVQQAWKRVPGEGYKLGPPKSEKSKRTANVAVAALVAVAPLLGKPSDWVFTTVTGRPVQHSNFYNRIWLPACREAKLEPTPTIHSLRHSFASWLISDGIQLEAVQDQLGHESILTTRKVYGHLLPALGVAVGRSASAALARALSERPETTPLAIGPVEGADQGDRPDGVALDLEDGRKG